MKTLMGNRPYAYVAPAVLLVITAAYVAVAHGYAPRAAMFPLIVGWAVLILLALDFMSRSKTNIGEAINVWLNGASSAEMNERKEENPIPLRTELAAFLVVAAFVAGMVFIGILYSVPIYTFASMRFLGKRSIKASAITAVAIGAFVYAMFIAFLGVELFPGILFGGQF